MKAVQIVAPNEMRVTEIEKPVLGAGEVLVKIKYVGFCGSDLNTYLGRNPMVKLPVVPGHEVGAVIEAVGEGVPENLTPGMTVTFHTPTADTALPVAMADTMPARIMKHLACSARE